MYHDEIMNINSPFEERRIVFRAPVPADGRLLCQIAKDAGGLDVNSEYAYMLHGLHHSDSCIVVEIDNRAAGFVSGYRLSKRMPDGWISFDRHLFIWQIAVRPDCRGIGLAKAMLLALIQRPENQNIRFLEATISPLNKASLAVFGHIATVMNADIQAIGKLDKESFGNLHEEEVIYRIGPLNREVSFK